MNKKIIFTLLIVVSILISCKSTKSPHELIKEDQLDQAQALFTVPYDINAVDEKGNTILHLLAEKNAPAEMITFYLLRGADPLIANANGDMPLHVAIDNNAIDAAVAIVTLNPQTLFEENIMGIKAIDLGLQQDDEYYDKFITTATGELRDRNGQTIVHYFVQKKNLKAVQQCIRKKIPISVKDNNGNTPLDLAFKNLKDLKSVTIAADLILAGADEVETDFAYFQDAISSRNYNKRFDDGQTPLHLSAIMGHSAIVQYLLRNGADTSVQDNSGATPLHEAVRYGNIDIATALLNAGADVNAKDNLGKTPIMLVLPKDKIYEIYSLLIQYKADLNQKDMFGDTLLHTATIMNLDTNILSILINNGAELDVRNKEGVTPLIIAVQKNNIPAISLFTSHGANIFMQDTRGESPLSMAFKGSKDLFEAVLNETNVLNQDTNGNTPLHIALMNDAPLDKIKYIISMTDDVNIRNSEGNNALFLATLKNRKSVGEMLLAKNADIFSTNTHNNSPLRLALQYGDKLAWLITSQTINSTDGSGNSVLHYAAEWQYKDAINSLLTKGAQITARNANGETVLFSAAKTNNPEIIQVVVDGGAEVQARDNLGSSALHIAVRWDAPESIKKLISLGLNVNGQNSVGKSPLAEAIVTGKNNIAKLLIEEGANPNSSDTDGVTVLVDAIKCKNNDGVRLLLDNGANPNIQDINGRNAYHAAAINGDIDIITLIKDQNGNALSRDKDGNTPFSLVMNKGIEVINAVLGENLNITDSEGNTPIHIVVSKNGSDELLQSLINQGYPADTRNAYGYTPLNYAIEGNMLKTALILLENGCDPFQMIDKKGKNGVIIALEKNNKDMIANIVKYAGNKTDNQGNTILHYAAKTGDLETVKFLMSFGIDKTIKNVSGETAYTIAMRWKKPLIADILK